MSAELSALPLARKRLRWRARRGLLENDLIISRFLERDGDSLTYDEMVSFETLLDLTESELLDVLLARSDLPDALDVPDVRAMLRRLRAE